MIPFADASRQQRLLVALGAAVVLAVFWSQALHVPYWQDDYFFLHNARQARLAGEPWHAAFWPEAKNTFWRPLGMETCWRFVEGVLGGEARAAHVVNILLLLAAATAVGWFRSARVRRLNPENNGLEAGAAAGFLYGVHAAHFLPAAWAAAANNSIALIFSALALRFWLVVLAGPKTRAMASLPAVALFFVLALLSRDIAVVLPALALLLALWLRPPRQVRAIAWATGALCIAVAVAWLLLRNHFTLESDPAYAMRLGLNVPRNTVVLGLFALNMPFEALRFLFFVRPSPGFFLWGLLPLLLQALALVLLLREALPQLGRKGLLVLGLFFLAGCGPAFFFSVNCYPYYITLGLLAYAVIAGLAAAGRARLPAIFLLAVLSSAIATLGNFFLDSPSHIGRARWAEKQLVRLAAMREARPDLFLPPLTVAVEDEHRFLGFRAEGLAWRLGMDLAEIEVREAEETEGSARPVLVVPADGDAYFRLPGNGPGNRPASVGSD